jgi:hypothetical protein
MSYRHFLAEADAYFKVATSSLQKPKKLGNKVLFNICTMMIEKYLVSLLLATGKAVSGHSIDSLIEKVSKSFPELPSQINELSNLDERMDLCSFNPISSIELSDEEMRELYAKLVVLKEFVHHHVSLVMSNPTI